MIEVEAFVNARTVEHAYSVVTAAQRTRDNELARKGLRAAKARDPKLLKALELGANVIDHVAESQYGQTMRSIGSEGVYRVQPTEAQLWREAYVTVDKGAPIEPLSWIYAAGAILAGLIS